MHGNQIGSVLLDTVKLFFVTDNRTGCRFLTVDAYRDAKGFYEKNGFVAALLPEEEQSDSQTIPMFYDLHRIKKQRPTAESPPDAVLFHFFSEAKTL